MILRCFALSYYLYCLQLRCLVSFSFYSTINNETAALLRFAVSIYVWCQFVCSFYAVFDFCLICLNTAKSHSKHGDNLPAVAFALQ
ncbi:Uncharacterised protein [Neisseria animalis]|nr:Uncharacterised protein [Neisseria animalis]